MPSLQTVLFPFLLRDFFLSLGAQKEVLSQVKFLCGMLFVELALPEPLKFWPCPQRVLMFTGLVSPTCFSLSSPLQQEQPESKQ